MFWHIVANFANYILANINEFTTSKGMRWGGGVNSGFRNTSIASLFHVNVHNMLTQVLTYIRQLLLINLVPVVTKRGWRTSRPVCMACIQQSPEPKQKRTCVLVSFCSLILPMHGESIVSVSCTSSWHPIRQPGSFNVAFDYKLLQLSRASSQPIVFCKNLL